jgi:crotonobetainyl-CoA:carnitine CoA-transferase CaiB-like acyl-CoA transferase
MGPLSGVKILEIAGIGPAPMASMLLAELGATVLRLDRPIASDLGLGIPLQKELLLRSRPAISVDLKSGHGIQFVLDLVTSADMLLEGFRPGVMERLGLGPDICLKRNSRLVYGRMTGWGQTGPLAHTAGHDLNYIALSGALDAIGRAGSPPTPPLNLVGDFGGGALYLTLGMLAALTFARSTGKGQVVDAAMVDGAASLMTLFYGLRAANLFNSPRGTNVLDSGAPYYDVYQCADGGYLAVAAIEMKFRRELLEKLGLYGSVPDGEDPDKWPELRAAIEKVVRSKSRAEWSTIFDGSDACVSPVLSMAEVHLHPHNHHRETFVDVEGIIQPAPAPRFSVTALAPPQRPTPVDSDVAAALAPWGLSSAAVDTLVANRVVGLTVK